MPEPTKDFSFDAVHRFREAEISPEIVRGADGHQLMLVLSEDVIRSTSLDVEDVPDDEIDVRDDSPRSNFIQALRKELHVDRFPDVIEELLRITGSQKDASRFAILLEHDIVRIINKLAGRGEVTVHWAKPDIIFTPIESIEGFDKKTLDLLNEFLLEVAKYVNLPIVDMPEMYDSKRRHVIRDHLLGNLFSAAFRNVLNMSKLRYQNTVGLNFFWSVLEANLERLKKGNEENGTFLRIYSHIMQIKTILYVIDWDKSGQADYANTLVGTIRSRDDIRRITSEVKKREIPYDKLTRDAKLDFVNNVNKNYANFLQELRDLIKNA